MSVPAKPKCSQCAADPEINGGRDHRHWCPRQSDHERIKELEEALILSRYEINRALDTP